MSDTERFVNLGNARHDDQLKVMENIQDNEHCPFCPEQLEKYHHQPILRRGEHWLLTPNQWPYEHTRIHLLAIATYHVERLADLKPGAGDELLEHMKWAEDEYRVAAGAVAMRFGDIQRTGATVSHLHEHLIVASDDKPVGEKIRFKVSS